MYFLFVFTIQYLFNMFNYFHTVCVSILLLVPTHAAPGAAGAPHPLPGGRAEGHGTVEETEFDSGATGNGATQLSLKLTSSEVRRKTWRLLKLIY